MTRRRVGNRGIFILQIPRKGRGRVRVRLEWVWGKGPGGQVHGRERER